MEPGNCQRMESPARLIATICLAEAICMAAFSAFATLLPMLAPEFGLSNTQAGLISGIVLGGYMVGVALLGPLTDRMDARRVYAVSAFVAAAGALGFALFARGFWTALVSQSLIGFGLAGSYISGMKALTDRIAGRWQTRAAAWYGATFGIGASLSMASCGLIAGAFGWRTAFMAASAGSLLAAAIVMTALERSVPRPTARPALLDFRPVIRNRAVRPYLFASGTHSWELHGTRAWLVAFLTFAADEQGGTGGAPVSIALTAAIIYLFGPVASVCGNELALRYGRARVMVAGPAASAVLSCAIGFLAGSPWLALLAFAAVHMFFVTMDAGAITGGVVPAAEPAHRGATISLYSLTGFGMGCVAPAAFGVILDLGGGRGELVAWGLAFASLGAVAVLGIIPARRLAVSAGERAGS
jgi:MFS family permease